MKTYQHNTKNVDKFNRLKQVSSQVWSLLTQEEQEAYYYDLGTIGFIEHVAEVLRINLDQDFDDLPNSEDEDINSWFDELLDNLDIGTHGDKPSDWFVGNDTTKEREYLVHLNVTTFGTELTEQDVETIALLAQAYLGNHADSVCCPLWEEVQQNRKEDK